MNRGTNMQIKDNILTIKEVDGEEHTFSVEKIRKLTKYLNKEEPYETVCCLSYLIDESSIFIFAYTGEIEISEEDFDKVKHYLDNYENVEDSETIVETNINYTFK